MLDVSPRARPHPGPPSPAELVRLRAQLQSTQADPDRLPAYAAWLDAELAAQPGRLAALGLPVIGCERPAAAATAVLACYERRCARCQAVFVAEGHGRSAMCPPCRPAAKREALAAYDRTPARQAYHRAYRLQRAAAQGGAA